MNGIYNNIVRFENVLKAWQEFRKGKKSKQDVLQFEYQLEENLFNLQKDLLNKTYLPGKYTKFYIKDPKMRLIHKATVQDRLIHHLVSKYLEDIFEPTFYIHSYSSRKNKGTQKAVLTLQGMANRISNQGQEVCWILKLDIKKFFASVNHKILMELLAQQIDNGDFLNLLQKIVGSFNKQGMPIGNLTSQYFANIYLNQLDQFITQKLNLQYYIRYADDFVILSENRQDLINLIPVIKQFLKLNLNLNLHPQKIVLRKFRSGIDFLGYIIFPTHIIPRTKTKRRLIKKIIDRINEYNQDEISRQTLESTINSYLGYLSHANTYAFRKGLTRMIEARIGVQKPSIKNPNP